MCVQNLAPNMDGKSSKACSHNDFASGVAIGGPWHAILVRVTALEIVIESLPVVTLPYVLNMDSAGASENAHGETEKSVFATLFLIAFQSCTIYESHTALASVMDMVGALVFLS